jgi:hypothetical protein
LPLQVGCPHLQSMSGIFSIDSHCTPQYFPAIAVHEQFGCAHFLVFSIAIFLSPDQSVLDSLASASLPQSEFFETSNVAKIRELQIRVCSILLSVGHASPTGYQVSRSPSMPRVGVGVRYPNRAPVTLGEV